MTATIHTIVIHASDSPHRGDSAATIHGWHKERGWDGIGYHYVITEDGVVELGRPHYWTGSHVAGHNTNTLGICLLGLGTDITDFTPNQMDALYSLVARLLSMYPEAGVCGHRDLDDRKTCPGFDVKAWLEENLL